MIKLFICINPDCINKDVEYYLTDPLPVTICGGCKDVLTGVEVNE